MLINFSLYCLIAANLFSTFCHVLAYHHVSLFRTKDSSERDGLHPEHLAKRPCTISPSHRFSPSTGLPAHPPPNGLPTHPPNGLPHPPNPQVGPQHYRLEDMALAHQYRDAYRHTDHRDSRDRHRPTGTAAKKHASGWIHLLIRSHMLHTYMVRTEWACVNISRVYVVNKGQLSVQCDYPCGHVSI